MSSRKSIREFKKKTMPQIVKMYQDNLKMDIELTPAQIAKGFDMTAETVSTWLDQAGVRKKRVYSAENMARRARNNPTISLKDSDSKFAAAMGAMRFDEVAPRYQGV